jgi:hypothetical protein
MKTPAIFDFGALRAAALKGDPALLAAEERCRELRDQIAAVGRAHQPITIAIEREFIEPLDEARVAAERIIFNTMPETLTGAAVKLRLLAHPDRGVEATEEEVLAIRQVLEMVERLPEAQLSAAAEPVTGDHRILALFHEWRASNDRLDAVGDLDENDPVFVTALARHRATIKATEEAIVETPADGIGIAVKFFLGLWDADPELSGGVDAFARSALRDAARLVPELAPLCTRVLAENEEKQT